METDIIPKYVDACLNKGLTLDKTLAGIPEIHHERIKKLYAIGKRIIADWWKNYEKNYS